jgi:hypothetical protein
MYSAVHTFASPIKTVMPKRQRGGIAVFRKSADVRDVQSNAPLHNHCAPVQAKLEISNPGDPHEREADTVAAKVMANAQPSPTPLTCVTSANVNRAGDGGEWHAGNDFERSIESSKNDGAPLPDSTRAGIEPYVNADLSNARIHTNKNAAAMSASIGARAFTVGNDVYFGRNAYNPHSSEGRGLIAHEAAHVVQQNKGNLSSATSTPHSMRGQATESCSTGLLQCAVTSQVSDTYTPGSATKPRSITQSLDPLQLSDTELLNEIMLIKQWLQNNPIPSSEKNHLMLTLSAMHLNAGTRKIAGYIRQYGFITENTLMGTFPGGKISVGLGKFGAGFSSGFLQGALLSIPEHAYRQLATELNSAENAILFNIGVQSGIPVGVLKDLKDNLIGITELLLYTSIPYQTYSIVKKGYEFSQAPRRSIERDLEMAKGILEFLHALEADHALLLTTGEYLGIHFGGDCGYWYSNIFMTMKPFLKGFTIGDKIGYIAFEIVLLFLPLEWIIKGTQASRVALAGSKLGQVLLKILERVPGISRIIKAHHAFEEARAAEKTIEAGKTIDATAEAGKTIGKAVDVDKAADAAKITEATTETEKSAIKTTENITIQPTSNKKPDAFKLNSIEPLKPAKVSKIGTLQENLKQIDKELARKNAEKLMVESEIKDRYIIELRSARAKMERYPKKRGEFEKIAEMAEEKCKDAQRTISNLEVDISELHAQKMEIANEINRIEQGIQFPIDRKTNTILEQHKFTNYDPITGIASIENGSIKIQKTEKGWRYIEKNKVVIEYEITIYKNQLGTNHFFEAHHAIQDTWAERFLSDFGYKSDDAPSILLRDSFSGTPHRTISDLQMGRLGDLEKRSYLEERDLLRRDMDKIGVPTEVQNKMLGEVDAYFRKLKNNIKDSSLRDKIFGKWE